MKTTDFMVGDWLRTSRGIAKVIAVDKIGLTFTIDGFDFDIDKYDKEEWFSPIPLTEEILLKNRMRVFEHRNPWQEAKNLIKKWYSKDGKFYVSYYRVGDMFTYTVGNGVSRICSIMYVHELQHALRILKIEREIEL